VSDWQVSVGGTIDDLAATLVDPTPYTQDDTWDALGRCTSTETPADSEGHRHNLNMTYSRAGTLTGVTLDETPYVTEICYNARGQRTAVWLGNGVLTRYAYDATTFRLLRQHSSIAIVQPDGTWHQSGPVLQDTSHTYDLVGNPLAIKERSPGSGTGATPDALDRSFSYDGLYRLTTATGREAADPLPQIWSAQPRGSNSTATQAYREVYDYDDAGNLLSLAHQAGTGGYTRTMTPVEASNRLAALSSGQTSLPYTYDAVGNLTAETDSRLFSWDGRNRMATFRVQAPGAALPSLWAQYRYDPAGQRVLKVVREQAGSLEITIYPGGPLERLTLVHSGTATSYDELHVHDLVARVAVCRLTPLPGDQRPAIGYFLSDRLGSNMVVVDSAGGWVNTEEYLPYGETSFGSYVRKRYRFTGKERDEESGLTYHGARFYAPWTGRWTVPDPAGNVDSPSLYAYCRGRPTIMRDPGGAQSETTESGSSGMCPVDGPLPPQTHGTQESPPKTSISDAIADWVKPKAKVHVKGKEGREEVREGGVYKNVPVNKPISKALPGYSISLFNKSGEVKKYELPSYYDSVHHVGYWASARLIPFEATAAKAGVSADHGLSLQVVEVSVKGAQGVAGLEVGNWLFGLTAEATGTLGNLEGRAGINDYQIGAEAEASIASLKIAVGLNIAGLNVSGFLQGVAGVEAGVTAGKRTSARVGVVAGGVEATGAKTSEKVYGWDVLIGGALNAALESKAMQSYRQYEQIMDMMSPN
jgi:RHS repeat-associated protein